jgi:hypothetical protein
VKMVMGMGEEGAIITEGQCRRVTVKQGSTGLTLCHYNCILGLLQISELC